MTSFYTQEELSTLGLKSYGKNVLISRKCSIYGASNITIGENVRIDDFCILSGNITLGSYIHISAYCALYGEYGIELESYSQVSSRVTIFSATDDFSGQALVGPCVCSDLRNVRGGKVILERHVVIGSGCTIFPNLTIKEGASVGAMSLINKSLNSWFVYVGIPCRPINRRSTQLLNLEIKSQKQHNETVS